MDGEDHFTDILVSVLLSLILGTLLFVLGWLTQPFFSSWWTKRQPLHSEELSFPTSVDMNSRQNFPSLVADVAQVDLTVIVTAKNQSAKLCVLLDHALAFLRSRAITKSSSVHQSPEYERSNFTTNSRKEAYSYEIIVADMASTDSTAASVLRFTHEYGSDVVRLLKLGSFDGKGAAITKAALRARGKYILIMDASSTVPFPEIKRLEYDIEQLEKKFATEEALVFGSHAHSHISTHHHTMSPLHAAVIHATRTVFQLLFIDDVYDAQCPFKLVTRKAAQLLFQRLHVQSYCIDYELVYAAYSLGVPFKERAVAKEEHSLNVPKLGTSLSILRDLLAMRISYSFGFWSVKA